MFAKRFFYVCAGLLCLALAYHLGATSATGAPPADDSVVATSANGTVVFTAKGNVYLNDNVGFPANWAFKGNVFTNSQPAQQR